MSDTPRTDAAISKSHGIATCIDVNFARQLERELADAKKTTEEAVALMSLAKTLRRKERERGDQWRDCARELAAFLRKTRFFSYTGLKRFDELEKGETVRG